MIVDGNQPYASPIAGARFFVVIASASGRVQTYRLLKFM